MLTDRDYMRAGRRAGRDAGNYAVPTLVLLNFLIFGLQCLSEHPATEFAARYDDVSNALSLNWQMTVGHWELWRLLTYMFVHGNIFHLLINIWGVYLFGSMLEARMGSERFLTMYFVSGVCGGALFLAFNADGASCVGASGALFGLLAAAAMLFPDAVMMLLFPPVPLKMKTMVVVFALLEVFFGVTGTDRMVAHMAHLGGLVGGYCYMRMVYKDQVFSLFGYLRSLLGGGGGHRRAPRGWTVTPAQSELPANELDRLLDKISSTGINSLTEAEMETLRRAREEIRNHR